MNLSSDLEISTTSITDYLIDYENYKSKKFNIEYSPFELSKY